MKRILLIPHIEIINANAKSSPYTIGFPAMTTWLGAVHAMERFVREKYPDVRFKSVAPVSHHFDLRTYRHSGGYVNSIINKKTPLNEKGLPPPFIEKAKCHLTVSLIIECENFKEEMLPEVTHLIKGKLRMAGGDITHAGQPEYLSLLSNQDHKNLMRRVTPGYCLVSRNNLIREAMENGLDPLDAILSYATVINESAITDDNKVKWLRHSKAKGFFVPISVGFQAISPMGKAENQRDRSVTHRFAENVVTLGEFVMPYRIEDIDDMLWRYNVDEKADLYLCTPNNSK